MRCICLFRQPLGGRVCGAEHRETSDWETEIWRVCQRSIIAVKRGYRIAPAGVTSAFALVYIVDGTREILTSIVLRPPRAETGVKMSSGEHSAAVQTQLTDDKTRIGGLIGRC
jgi:hypothetical protein